MSKYDFSDFDKPAYDFSDFENNKPKVSEIESFGRGLLSGASLGFADEITGGIESLLSDKSYEQARNESRNNYKTAQEANPISYGSGEFGGSLATAFVPGLNTAKLGSLGARVTANAGLGAVAGLGLSDSDNTMGQLKDAATGGALAGGLSYGLEKALPYVKNGLNSLKDKVSVDGFNKGVAKVGQFVSGADEDALLRNIERPNQIREAMSEGFSSDLGKQVVQEVDDLGLNLGKQVNKAKTDFYKSHGDVDILGVGQNLAEQVDNFLQIHSPSQKGFSALDKGQIEDLTNLKKVLKGGNFTGEDLVKFRDYLDQVERLANKYGNDTGPYTNFLKSLRSSADVTLDNLSPQIDKANTAFAQYKSDTNLLRSATNEGQSEKMINNLYGANKGAQQEAAQRLFSNETLEKAKDIAANKAVKQANQPGGQNYFRHGALPVMTLGASELITRPEVMAKALRGLGSLEQKVTYLLNNNPTSLGKFINPIKTAAQNGNQSLAATMFILQQNHPDFRQKMKELEQE